MRHLSGIVRNTCRCLNSDHDTSIFTMDTNPDATQKKALDLLKTISL